MDIKDITFVITTYKSENTIYNCLNSLPKEVSKIVIENSNNADLKIDLEKKYENLQCYLMAENLGYGKANNIGIHKSESDYVFILNPDAKLLKNTLNDLCQVLSQEDFSIAAPLDIKEKNKFVFKNKRIIDVDFVKGFATKSIQPSSFATTSNSCLVEVDINGNLSLNISKNESPFIPGISISEITN